MWLRIRDAKVKVTAIVFKGKSYSYKILVQLDIVMVV